SGRAIARLRRPHERNISTGASALGHPRRRFAKEEIHRRNVGERGKPGEHRANETETPWAPAGRSREQRASDCARLLARAHSRGAVRHLTTSRSHASSGSRKSCRLSAYTTLAWR